MPKNLNTKYFADSYSALAFVRSLCDGTEVIARIEFDFIGEMRRGPDGAARKAGFPYYVRYEVLTL